MAELVRHAFIRTVAILMLCLALTLAVVAILDHRKGGLNGPISIPVCYNNCMSLPDGAMNALRDALSGDRDELQSLFDTRNLCRAPIGYLKYARPDARLARANELLTHSELVTIDRENEVWTVTPGPRADGVLDALRGFFDPRAAKLACLPPLFTHYGMTVLALLSIAVIVLALGARPRR